jgi:UDP-N-acetylmuramoylalanine-D-glutamate ligase
MSGFYKIIEMSNIFSDHLDGIQDQNKKTAAKGSIVEHQTIE